MRLIVLSGICLALAATGAGAQPISFTYAGQSSEQGVNVYADGLISIAEMSPGVSRLSLTVSNVRSDYAGGDDNLFFFGTALVGPDAALFSGMSVYDTDTGAARSDLRFNLPNGLAGEMIDIDGNAIKIKDYFSGDDFGLAFGFSGRRGGDGVREGESVTLDYEVSGVSFSFLDDYYRTLEGYFAVARFKGIGAGGDDSSKTPGGEDNRIVGVPLPATTGLAFAGLGTLGLLARRRR